MKTIKNIALLVLVSLQAVAFAGGENSSNKMNLDSLIPIEEPVEEVPTEMVRGMSGSFVDTPAKAGTSADQTFHDQKLPLKGLIPIEEESETMTETVVVGVSTREERKL